METNQASEKSPEDPCWLVGMNSRGQWTARDRFSQHGGLFASLADAQKYARLQTVGRGTTILMTTGDLELDLSAAAPEARRHPESDGPRALESQGH